MSPRDPPSTSLALTAPSTGTTTISSSDEVETTPVLQATASMCHHCFDVLLHHLKQRDQQQQSSSSSKKSTGSIWRLGGGGGGGILTKPAAAAAALSSSLPAFLPSSTTQPAAIFVEDLPHENVECPLFVTWERKRPLSRFHIPSSSSSSKSNNSSNDQQQNHAHAFELRGCIGTLSPRPLATSIGEYALISAFKDKRFDAIKWTEVPNLRVAVSLLVQYEECRDCHDWHVGVHGIVIKWREHGGDDINSGGASSADDNNHDASSSRSSSSSRFQRATSITTTTTGHGGRDYSATYLPEVAADQGWDQQTAVSSLIRKAGFHGPVTPDFLARVQCTRYQSSKHRVTFEEYIMQQQQQQQSASSLSSSQAAASPFSQLLSQQEGQEQTTTTPSLSNDQLVAEAIRELGHLPKLQGGGGGGGGGSGRDASPPTCRVL